MNLDELSFEVKRAPSGWDSIRCRAPESRAADAPSLITKDKVVEIRQEKSAMIAKDFNRKARTPSATREYSENYKGGEATFLENCVSNWLIDDRIFNICLEESCSSTWLARECQWG